MLQYDASTFKQRTFPTGPPFPRNVDLYMSLFGLCQSLGNYRIEQVASYGTVFHAVQEGEGVLQIGGKTFDVKAGDVFILRKGGHYIYRDTPGKPWKYMYFTISGRASENYLDQLGLTVERSVINVASSINLWIKLDLLKEVLIKEGMRGVTPVRTGWELFELLKECSEQNSPREKIPLAETARHIIDSSSQIASNVNLLAEALRTSRATLFRHFKQYYGVSVKEYIDQKRLERIDKLLEIPSLSVDEIARMSGFSNPKYFRRLFREKLQKAHQAEKRE